jgi:hypothetical protein
MPEPMGRAWIGKPMRRGAWYYSAEADVGFCGALRTHATIVTRDPVFGEFAYGGVLSRTGGSVSVLPRDGLRVRFHVIRDAQRFHMTLERDGFARELPIIVSDALDSIQFTIENRGGGAHETGLAIAGLPDGTYTVTVDGRVASTLSAGTQRQVVRLAIPAAASARIAIVRSTQEAR